VQSRFCDASMMDFVDKVGFEAGVKRVGVVDTRQWQWWWWKTTLRHYRNRTIIIIIIIIIIVLLLLWLKR